MVLKTKEEARANFEAAITFIPSRFEAGVRKADWATPAGSDEAEKNFSTAMTAAIGKKSRQVGVRKITNADWQSAAVTKGVPIIGERIRIALPKYTANFGAVYDKILALVPTLPRRTIDFKANITSRLIPVVEAWKKAAGKL